ncbi:helix-turn-helix transcriptional regulator [Clostridium phage CWou-2020a]|uniref:HTH cro/C1-type domain-containing protein n=1 Tax=Clostridium botulinum C/D str. DC5 TaxID=1443128 RepID=A0A0A0I728_CLOBO|nr:helix-turn-helix transcriptional regulator [Clostridium botulinum]QPW59440.1 helix-turn-helix transcriptional regulator [Clostridium phage CWou-2020a]KGM96106.1 hypothetical protein Z955_13390 [Clostridium botulinum C/D str. DC5]KOC54172.1 hypothetical protein ADU90_12575 [Clostridium botulinum]KOC56516.1 hypothetical protein ADU89_02585 [Clostridium botulinum]MCD3241426.1 helix-turn-helix transcriptional regulator [Clostridium botulinum D/C]
MYKIKLDLKNKRLDANITQKFLATKCSLTQSAVSKIERNLQTTTLLALENFSNALDIHPLDLFIVIKK